jgi:hypothetical protein
MTVLLMLPAAHTTRAPAALAAGRPAAPAPSVGGGSAVTLRSRAGRDEGPPPVFPPFRPTVTAGIAAAPPFPMSVVSRFPSADAPLPSVRDGPPALADADSGRAGGRAWSAPRMIGGPAPVRRFASVCVGRSIRVSRLPLPSRAP